MMMASSSSRYTTWAQSYGQNSIGWARKVLLTSGLASHYCLDLKAAETCDYFRAMMDPGERETCLSQSSSTMSMPVCRICQLPSMEPNNMLISPCRCLGSIRYVHNNCLLVSQSSNMQQEMDVKCIWRNSFKQYMAYFQFFSYFFQKWLEVSSKRRTGPPSCELCQYQYLRHKKFVVRKNQLPL